MFFRCFLVYKVLIAQLCYCFLNECIGLSMDLFAFCVIALAVPWFLLLSCVRPDVSVTVFIKKD